MKKTIRYCELHLSLLAIAAFLSASCGSVMADGMVEEPPGAVSGASQGAILGGGKTPPVQRVGNDRVRQAAPGGIRRGNTTPLSPFELARYQYCGKDSDCAVEVNGCCDCANGGQEVAINRVRVEAFRKNFDCLNVACGDKMPETPCFSGVVSCVDRRCKYYTQDDFEQ